MNLKKKKELAAKTLGVGKNRISFSPDGLAEIKEAITKQDIKTLREEGIITIKPIKGRRKIQKRNRRKGPGKIKMKIKHRKQTYVKITRKLRKHLKLLKNENVIDRELYYELRRKIKMRTFRNLSHLKEYLASLKVLGTDKKLKRTKEDSKSKLKTAKSKEKKAK
jgi:large subunit ribosomal protein L19e